MKQFALIPSLAAIIAILQPAAASAQSYPSSGGSYRTNSSSYLPGHSRYNSDEMYDSARNTDRLLKVIKGAPERSIDTRYSNEVRSNAFTDRRTLGLPPGSLSRSLRSGTDKKDTGILTQLTDSIYRLWEKWGGYDVKR